MDIAEVHCPVCRSVCTADPLEFQNANSSSACEPSPIGNWEIVLDNVRSTHNVGSILRSCEAAGVGRVHCCGITPGPDHPGVAKTALGAERRLQIWRHPNGLSLVEGFRSQGKMIAVLEITPRALPIDRIDPVQEHNVLVVGNERAGVDPAILALAHHHFFLPLAGQKESLNVANALTAALYCIWAGFRNRERK